MSDLIMRQEHMLVVEQRGDDPAAVARKPYRVTRYAKGTEDKALAGLTDWEENRQGVLDSGTGQYILNWTAHIEQRIVTETPWERLVL